MFRQGNYQAVLYKGLTGVPVVKALIENKNNKVYLLRGKAPGRNEVLRLSTTVSMIHHLAQLFTSSIQIGYNLRTWKLVTHRVTEAKETPVSYL